MDFEAIWEPTPGPRWQARFERNWPVYRAWFLREGDASRPSYAAARQALREHVPELVATWERMVELAGGGDVAARMLSLYDPPPLVSACSQAVFGGDVLVRNYDFDAARLEGVIYATALTGRRVMGMSDCLWGLVDGVNDAGLAVSLAFGGRRLTAPGFAISLVVRYLLETCGTTAQALETLGRLPVQGAYNLTFLDAAGEAATAEVAPDGPPLLGALPVATNHQHVADWPEHDAASHTREREERMLALLADPAIDEPAFLDAFLEPPLHNGADGFGTLYTAVYRPAARAAVYRWPRCSWPQSLDAFEEGRRTVRVPVSKRANDWSQVTLGQR